MPKRASRKDDLVATKVSASLPNLLSSTLSKGTIVYLIAKPQIQESLSLSPYIHQQILLALFDNVA